MRVLQLELNSLAFRSSTAVGLIEVERGRAGLAVIADETGSIGGPMQSVWLNLFDDRYGSKPEVTTANRLRRLLTQKQTR